VEQLPPRALRHMIICAGIIIPRRIFGSADRFCLMIQVFNDCALPRAPFHASSERSQPLVDHLAE
jgi:hypothetical protein